MAALVGALALSVMSGTIAVAHGNNEHVRGVVSAISDTSITVQTPDKSTKTLTLTAKTAFEKGGVKVTRNDLKVGDRVVIDVPKGTLEAAEIQAGAPKKASK